MLRRRIAGNSSFGATGRLEKVAYDKGSAGLPSTEKGSNVSRDERGSIMSERTKYIVVEIFCGIMKMETPILFPPHVGHNDMARSLGIAPDDVLGAGYVRFSAVDVADGRHSGQPFHVVEARVYGESTSLKVKSREEDSRLISQAMKIGDYDL